jgi:hypothetical protein
MINHPDCDSFNRKPDNTNKILAQDEGGYCRLRAHESRLLPELSDVRHQKTPEYSHMNSVYTEETNPAISSAYLEKN